MPVSPGLFHQFIRTDFEIGETRSDPRTGALEWRMDPDPRRYDAVEREGRTFFVDRYFGHEFTLDELAAAHKGPPAPIHALPTSIGSARDYAADRRHAVEEELDTGVRREPAEPAQPHRPLNEGPIGDLAFLSVDVCGSTALRMQDETAFDRAYELMLKELGTAVGQFQGQVLKTTGDGFIAYVDHPSFANACDNAVDLGMTMLLLMRDSINSGLADRGLPPLQLRIGGDYGAARAKRVTVPGTGFSALDLASDALNRAVKLQEAAEPGQLRIGRALYELVHVGWLERSYEVPVNTTALGLPDYRAYVVR